MQAAAPSHFLAPATRSIQALQELNFEILQKHERTFARLRMTRIHPSHSWYELDFKAPQFLYSDHFTSFWNMWSWHKYPAGPKALNKSGTHLTAVGDANVATGEAAASEMVDSSRPLTVSCIKCSEWSQSKTQSFYTWFTLQKCKRKMTILLCAVTRNKRYSKTRRSTCCEENQRPCDLQRSLLVITSNVPLSMYSYVWREIHALLVQSLWPY